MTALLAATLASWITVTAYSFEDVARDIVPGRQGVGALREIAGVLDRTSVKTTTNAETEEFFVFLKKTLEQFDFMKLYRSKYCDSKENGFCTVTLQGCGGERNYHVVMENAATPRCPMKNLWDFRTDYSLKLNEHNVAGGKSFIVSLSSRTATGRYSHRNAMTFATSVLRVLDPSGMHALRAPRAPVFTAIEGDARNVVNDFHRSFPAISGLFDRFAELRSIAEVRVHNGIPYTRCEVRYGYRMKNLAAEFPRLAQSLEQIRGLYRITMDIKNPGGKTFLYLVFDSREDVFSLSCYTRQGKLIPRDDAGNPVFSEEFSPAALTDFTYTAILGMVHSVHGLIFTTPSSTVRFSYRVTPAGGSWRIKLLDVSKTVISGSYYNILPPWLIDAFIPGDMEQMIYDFSRILISGNEGRGAGVSFEWDTRNPAAVMLDFRAFGEFMDNQFLRYGLKVWSKKTIGDRKLAEEAKMLQGLLITSFIADLDRLKR
jgi:hypothetical protein